MYKNQLQELAQRSCFNLPAYGWKREGPDHAPRFKASVNFNGEIFESPYYCSTLRQAQHSAAELALNVLSSRASKSLTARVLDETGVYKNLLQETAHKAGLNLPVYRTVRRGAGHVPVFTCTVELAGLSFAGHSAKTKKQAEKNAAITAWSSLKKVPKLLVSQIGDKNQNDDDNQDQEQEQVIVAKVLSNFRAKTGEKHKDYQNPGRLRNVRGFRSDNLDIPSFKNSEFPQNKQSKNSFIDLLPPPPPRTTSKILPLATTTNNCCPRKNIEGQNGNFFQDPNNDEQWQTQFRASSLYCFREGQNGQFIQDPNNKEQRQTQLRASSMMYPFREGQNGNFSQDPSNKEQGQTQFRTSSFSTSMMHCFRQGQNGQFLQDPNNKEQGQTQFRATSMYCLGPKTTNPSNSLKRVSTMPNLSCAQTGIFGNYNINPTGIAQAVQIRSVIPVFSGPPSSIFNPILSLEKPSSNSVSTSLSTNLASAHLSSELSKLQVKEG